MGGFLWVAVRAQGYGRSQSVAARAYTLDPDPRIARCMRGPLGASTRPSAVEAARSAPTSYNPTACWGRRALPGHGRGPARLRGTPRT